MTPTRHRKRPVVIDALQWTGDTEALTDFVGIEGWTRADAVDMAYMGDGEEVVIWNELEQVHIPCPVGHWVIRGVVGEFYPCDPDVFAATYEPEETPDA